MTVPPTRSSAPRSAKTVATKKARRTILVAGGAIVVLVIAMSLGTKVVSGEEANATSGKFSASAFADQKWDSEILPTILDNAVDIVTVSTSIQEDAVAAGAEYGVVEGTSAPVFSVSFTGIAGLTEAGIMPVTVEGMPDGVSVRVQMGPAINGTAVRDASGTVHYPQFTNQIDYQDAGAALNDTVKSTVLAGIDSAALNGQTVTMTGVFQLINPASYLLTPVQIESAK